MLGNDVTERLVHGVLDRILDLPSTEDAQGGQSGAGLDCDVKAGLSTADIADRLVIPGYLWVGGPGC